MIHCWKNAWKDTKVFKEKSGGKQGFLVLAMSLSRSWSFIGDVVLHFYLHFQFTSMLRYSYYLLEYHSGILL